MPLIPGTRIGPYEITGSVGAGGMGEVYRARDTRLDRSVAVKVLHGSVAEAPERRARFDREARAISALNHPHICTLHDIGHEAGVDYLVMEYLEGETLADRLARGPLAPDQVLRYGIEIASALALAHRAGIVHRDLKPGNVMLTRAGVKLLDFGLAKLHAGRDAGLPSERTMLEQPLTGAGTLLGTLPYMAPEQVEGKEADARSDIWALGTVLHEMATGRRPFEGKSQASLIGAILRDDPPSIATVQAVAPHGIDRVVKACLEKDPDERWHSARDVERELRWIAEARDRAPESGAPRLSPRMLAAATVGVLAIGGVLGWLTAWQSAVAVPRPDSSASAAIRRVSILLPEQAPMASPSATPFNYLRRSFAASPDGSRIVYVSSARGGATQLHVRYADRYEPTPIAGTEGGFDPFFSPDGEWVGYFTFDSLLKVSLKGGAPLTLSAVVNPTGGTWCEDGSIYFSADEGDELWRLTDGGGTGDQTAKRIPLTNAQSWYPQCLPGSTGLLLTMVEMDADQVARRRTWWPLSADYAAVGVLRLPAQESSAERLVSRGYAPQYAPSGHLVFARGGSLVAAPFDMKELRVTGPESVVLDDVRMNSVSVAAAQFTITHGGSLLYVRGGDHSRTELVRVDRQGRVEPTAAAPNLFGTLQLSPDGRRAVVEVGGLQNDVYVYDLQDGRRIRVTSDGKGGTRGVWHPDGRRVLFMLGRDDGLLLKQVESDTAPEALPLTDRTISSWSATGLLAGIHEERIWIGSLEQQRTITSAGRGRAWGAVLSRDAAFVAYTSSRTGTFQVFAQPNPPTGQEWQLSGDFGEEPVWSRSAPELFFRRHNQWWSVSFADGTPGAPRLLFDGPFFNAFGPSYDVAPDGRFLMALPRGTAVATRDLLWIQNWAEELRTRMSRVR